MGVGGEWEEEGYSPETLSQASVGGWNWETHVCKYGKVEPGMIISGKAESSLQSWSQEELSLERLDLQELVWRDFSLEGLNHGRLMLERVGLERYCPGKD